MDINNIDLKKLLIKLCIVLIILLLYHPGNLLLVSLIVVILFLCAVLLLLLKDHICSNKCIKMKKICTKPLKATIIQLKREPEAEFDYITFACKLDSGGRVYESDQMEETRSVEVGDKVTVYVNPDNYNEYYIDLMQ